MGSGKTTIGRLLAKKLHRKFIDSDSEIQKIAQKSISEIFEEKGEEHFRTLEAQTIQNLAKETNLVISLGGGAVMDPHNQEIFAKGVWIFLNTPFAIIKERVSRNDYRPLAKDTKKFEELYKKRLPMYQKAKVVIDCEGDPENVCQMILNHILRSV